jgi:hypothetical protein
LKRLRKTKAVLSQGVQPLARLSSHGTRKIKHECMELCLHFSIPGVYIRENFNVYLANTLGTSRNYFPTKHFDSMNTSVIISGSHGDIPWRQRE